MSNAISRLVNSTTDDAVVIDATTQPGYAGTPVIVLSGANAPASSNGLVVSAANSLIRGLAINGWPNNGIFGGTVGGSRYEANFIGTNAAGDADLGKAVQFERLGYFTPDPDTSAAKPVFNRTVGLRDTYAKVTAGGAKGR